MKLYKHLFFDLDHTLWDFERNSGATLAILFEEFDLPAMGIPGFEVFRVTYEAHNERLWARYRNGFIRREELRWKRMWHTLVDFKIGDEKFARMLSDRYLDLLPQQGLLLPHASEILDYCQGKGYNLHLITNGFETTQLQKIRNARIDHYFIHMITSESSNSLKPHPGIFDYALTVTGADLAESIIIGDTLEADIIGGINYGMDQVYYNPAKKPHSELPTHEISCLSELQDIF